MRCVDVRGPHAHEIAWPVVAMALCLGVIGLLLVQMGRPGTRLPGGSEEARQVLYGLGLCGGAYFLVTVGATLLVSLGAVGGLYSRRAKNGLSLTTPLGRLGFRFGRLDVGAGPVRLEQRQVASAGAVVTYHQLRVYDSAGRRIVANSFVPFTPESLASFRRALVDTGVEVLP